MRGKAASQTFQTSSFRITPAYAGKSLITPKYLQYPKDHPRLCGEKHCRFHLVCRKLGSPPPMRGKANPENKPNVNHRITPAYAGKSNPTRTWTLVTEDHPRLCGEKGFGLFPQPLYLGSPPPMRGKVLDRQIFPIIRRITPAYAGKSCRKPQTLHM